MSPADLRTVAELLADSDALARHTLLDTTIDHAPAMVRSSNQLIESAADLWTILPSERNNTSGSDPMERVRMVVDPFLGLGSTAVACAQLGVDFVGIELDEEYLAQAIARTRAAV